MKRNKDFRMNNPRLILGIIFTAAILIFAVYQYIKNDKEAEELFHKMRIEYPTLLYIDSINSEVTNIYKYIGNYSTNPYAVSFTTMDSKQLTIYSYKCFNNSEIDIEDVIKVGTGLQKESGTDTLKVIYKNEVLRFIIKESFE